MRQPHFIKEWRKARGLTQRQLADKIGIDRSYVTYIENGKRRYDQPFLQDAAQALDCDPADLLIRHPMDPEGIWGLWDTLDETQRAQLVEIGKTLKRTA